MKNYIKLLIAAIVVSLIPITIAESQDWGYMNLISWENPPPNYILGFFNPSYSQSDSLLYFDAFYRLDQAEGYLIYITHLDSCDQYNELHWADPILLGEPINAAGSRNVMPNINHAGDSLFFCSDRQGTHGGFDLWLSVKINVTWTDPVNLGDSVNTAADEYSPFYSPFLGRLFFDRSDDWLEATIYSCNSMGQNTWSLATPLPPIINIPGNYNYSPYFDEDDLYLYFTSIDFLQDPDPLLRSKYSNGSWETPAALDSNVNGFTNPPPPCSLVTVEHASISEDHRLLFYNKHLWEVSNCFDFYSYLMYSYYQPVNIENPFDNQPKALNLNIYPNPSNSRFNFTVNNDGVNYQLTIYDITGRMVRTFQTDNPSISWDCTDFRGASLGSGVYFAKINYNSTSIAKKLLFLK